jgi:hypothetical protein
MLKKRIAYLALFIVMISATPRAVLSAQSPSPVVITTYTTPEPILHQLTSGDKCSFRVEIQNLGVSVQMGQVVNASDPTVKYSGNFTVEALFELRTQGRLYYGGQSIGYITSLNNTQIDNYYSTTIPPINQTLKYTFTYNLTKGYETFGVRPDENLVLYFRVNVFVQTYSDKDGEYRLNVGDRVKTLRNDYYIIEFVKKEFIEGKFSDIKGELGQLNNINSDQVQIGKEYYIKLLDNLNSTIKRGDYVNALELIENYYQFEQPNLVSLLFSNLNSTGQAADEYLNLKKDYATLDANHRLLESDYEAVLYLNNLQESYITQLKEQIQNSKVDLLILSVTGIITMFAVGFILGRKPRFSFP